MRARIGGGKGIFGGRTGADGSGCIRGAMGGGDKGMASDAPIFTEASPIFISGNFISPKWKSAIGPAPSSLVEASVDGEKALFAGNADNCRDS